jgi:hypothetical protein
MTPQECVLDAVLRAQGILAEYIEPGRHDCEQTIGRLFDIFDDQTLTSAVNTLNLNLARAQFGTAAEGKLQRQSGGPPLNSSHR